MVDRRARYRGGGGEAVVIKVRENIVSNIVISSQGDRGLLELVG